MREIEYTITIRLTVDDRITDAEVNEDLGKLLAGDQARRLLQEPSPTRYERGWWLESARVTDALTVLAWQATAWERLADRREVESRAAKNVGNEPLAAQRAEAAYTLRYCARQIRDAIGLGEGNGQ